jgi:hypothetical protein
VSSLAKQILSESHLKAIGLVAAEWSYTEVFLESLIWEVGDLHERGYAITTHIQSETRLFMLEALAETRVPSGATKAEIKKVVAEIRRLRTDRNNIVHSLWLSPAQPQGLITGAMFRKRKPTPKATKVQAKGKVVISSKPFTARQIMATVSEIADLVGKMGDLLSKIQKERENREAVLKALLERQTPALALDPNTKGSLAQLLEYQGVPLPLRAASSD